MRQTQTMAGAARLVSIWLWTVRVGASWCKSVISLGSASGRRGRSAAHVMVRELCQLPSGIWLDRDEEHNDDDDDDELGARACVCMNCLQSSDSCSLLIALALTPSEQANALIFVSSFN